VGAGERPESGTAATGCTKTLTAGHGNLNRFVRHLRPGSVGCLRGSFQTSLSIRRGGFTLKSAPGPRASIVGVVYFSRTAHDVVLSGLRLRSTTSPNVRINGTRITIRRSEITNGQTGICISVGGSFARWGIARGVTIVQNRIHDCGRLPATNHDHGIYVEGARNTLIRGNLIYDNADRGVQLFPDAQGTIVENNVIDGVGEGILFAGGDGLTGIGPYASSNNTIRRNVISNSTVRWLVESYWLLGQPVGTGNVVTGNCLWPTNPNPYYNLNGGVTIELPLGFTASNNKIANPGFVDRAAKDFRLRPGSPCTGTGPR
jgi:parallel beta-helix repeat protein